MKLAAARATSPVYTKRVQTVLSADQYELLLKIAKERGKPVSVLIREAVEAEYFKEAALQQRRTALEDLLSLKAPVADWEEMEKEITKGALGG
jgi:hypothetical protein